MRSTRVRTDIKNGIIHNYNLSPTGTPSAGTQDAYLMVYRRQSYSHRPEDEQTGCWEDLCYSQAVLQTTTLPASGPLLSSERASIVRSSREDT